MSIEVATGDLLRGLTLLGAKEDDAVRLALLPGLSELTMWRGYSETVVWAVESQIEGPTATVDAGELRGALDRPMISIIEGLANGGLRVADVELSPRAEVPAPPRPASMLGGLDLVLPHAPANPYAPVLADIDQGGSKVWIPYPLVQRFRLRQMSRLRLFPELGCWYLSGATLEDTHLLRVVGRVNVY